MSNQLATIEDTISAVIPAARELVKVHRAIDINAEQNYAIQQLYKNDYNVKVALAAPVSVQNAVRNLSSIGISLNPALKHAYLVPRDGQICLDVSYMGLMHLAQQEGAILWGQAHIVYANDSYVNKGVDKAPEHTYSAFGDRGEPVGCFCTVKLPNGDFITEEMSAADIEQVRQTSKAKDSKHSPWQTFPMEMWRKTVVKRASKYWPKSGSSRFDEAVHVVNEHEGIEQTQEQVDFIKKLADYTSDKHTPLELFGFMEWYKAKYGEDAYFELFRRFPPGQKVSGKEKHKQGSNQYFDYLEVFKSGDESAIEECKAELTEVELRIINEGLERTEKVAA